ncbi:La-related protein 6 isoform 1 [Gossypium australe]|uniref:La-related protein 6 isoform 1 n=1 Tax=Gossypium australe TaxID=47621 RepID=A0A5B6VR35_9ROSI|nr:La-related protein 6 isoform 1 [Gossypium australe]
MLSHLVENPKQSFPILLLSLLAGSTQTTTTIPPAFKYSIDMRNEKQLAKLAMVTLAAGVLTLGSVGDASAAKTGGRVGGQAFRSAAPRSAPRANNNSRTNIYINPRVAPPLVGGYGYGYGVPFYGGWGWSPFSFFAPGPSVAVGVGGGFDTLLLFMFLGAFAAVVRRFFGSRNEDEDEY